MALASHSPVAFTGTPASNLLRSSSNGVRGVPLRTLGRTRLGTSTRRDFTVSAKVRKGRKHDHPWPSDLNPDPNVKGGILSYLSHFKPLKEKPKPVTLEFEKPLVDLEKKINDIRKMADDTGMDFSEQILSLENKYNLALKDLYTHLTPIQRVHIARHPNRPTFLDHIFNITEKFVELHGDRAGYDDPAIVTGIGTIDGQRYMFIGHQKGRNTKENIQRNFGMPTPHGYRKALRMMHYADHHGFPIVTLVDTPGAFADLKSEELGQGEAIAQNLRTMFGLKVPIISIVIGEGGSGGALAIACANKLLMLENAVFYVASPEACAAILWKTAKAAPKAAEKLKITATELCKLQVADGVIPEPLGGAHADPAWTSQQIKNAINEGMAELKKMDTEELLKHRAAKFRKIGGFQEGIPVDPAKSFNMKKKDVPIDPKERQLELEREVDNLKQQIAKAAESSGEPPKLGLNKTLEKLKKEIDLEFFEASKSLGFKEKFDALREDFSKMNSGDPVDPAFKSKLDNLRSLFDQSLPNAPNYESLQSKLGMLKELSKALSLAERNHMAAVMKQEVNRKMEEVKERPGFKEKLSELKSEIKRSGASRWEDLDDDVKEKLATLKAEVEPEFVEVLQSSGLEVNIDRSKEDIPLPSEEAQEKIENLNEEIQKSIETIIDSTDVKYSIEQLKLEIARAGKKPDEAAKKRIAEIQQRIKQTLASALESSELKQKHDKLKAEISESVVESSFEGIDGRFISANGRTP